MKKLISRRQFLAAMGMAAAAGMLAGCGSEAQAGAGSGAGQDHLAVVIPGDPGDLSPLSTGTNATYVLMQIYEPLFDLGYDMELVPVLAKSWTQVDDVHYTIQLNENVTDSQGNPFTTEDVLFVFGVYAADPENSAYVANIDMEKTRAVDDFTLELYLLAPNIATFTNLSSVRMFTRKAWEASEDEMVTTPVGTGAYQLSNYIGGSSVELAAREDYWGAAPFIQSVHFSIISEPSQATTALEIGEADLVIGLQSSDANYINNKDDLTTLVDASISSMSMYFNMTEDSVMQHLAVRQAVCYALDNTAINKAAYGGLAMPSVCPFSTAMRDYTEALNHETYLVCDMEKAAAVLAEAGISGGHIRIATSGTMEESTIAEITQSVMMDLGFTVEINNYDSATIWSVAADPTSWDIVLNVGAAPSGYGIDQMNAFLCFLNWSQWSGPAYDEFVQTANAAIGSASLEEAQDKITEAVRIVEEEIPTYSLVQLSNIYGFKSNLNFRVWNQASLLVRELKFS